MKKLLCDIIIENEELGWDKSYKEYLADKEKYPNGYIIGEHIGFNQEFGQYVISLNKDGSTTIRHVNLDTEENINHRLSKEDFIQKYPENINYINLEEVCEELIKEFYFYAKKIQHIVKENSVLENIEKFIEFEYLLEKIYELWCYEEVLYLNKKELRKYLSNLKDGIREYKRNQMETKSGRYNLLFELRE